MGRHEINAIALGNECSEKLAKSVDASELTTDRVIAATMVDGLMAISISLAAIADEIANTGDPT